MIAKKVEDILEILVIWGIALIAPFSLMVVVFADEINEFHSQDQAIEEEDTGWQDDGTYRVNSLESHLDMCETPEIRNREECIISAYELWEE